MLIGTELWVVSRVEGTVWQLRADTGERLGAPIPVGSGPRDPVYDGQRFVWISNTDSGTVQRIDLDTIRTGP